MSAGAREVRAVPRGTNRMSSGHYVDLAWPYVDNLLILRGPHAWSGNIGWQTWSVLYFKDPYGPSMLLFSKCFYILD
jgi:hypothetical protein